MTRKAFAAAYLLGLCLLLSACGHTDTHAAQEPDSGVAIQERLEALDQWMQSNPCGVLRMRQPFFNVSGEVTAKVELGSHVYLYTAHNTYLAGAIYVTEHCRAITRMPINEDNYFSINSLPLGTYVLSVPIDSFGPAQGFPVVREFNRSGHSLQVAFHGGDNRHSLCAFTITATS